MIDATGRKKAAVAKDKVRRRIHIDSRRLFRIAADKLPNQLIAQFVGFRAGDITGHFVSSFIATAFGQALDTMKFLEYNCHRTS